ncbi:MAG: hypothetical protein RL514_3990 [Verrucomicrobiota bacterium]|jgi:hypothetical protein
MKRLALLLGIACVCLTASVACRKRGAASAPGPDATGASSADGNPAPKTFASPPPLPPNAPPPVSESVQFYPPQPVNMYAPARPGDYQAQLDIYNRVLRKWTQSQSIVPNDLNHLMGIYNSPKPPQPPAGRRLVLDRKTVTVSLQ